MVPIDASHFYMGSDDDLPAEKPAHPVTLAPFCIDRTEVTVADYKKCSDDGRCKRAPTSNEWPQISSRERKSFDAQCNARSPEERAKHPVNCVDWEMATNYCAAQGERLPSEAEWELAARGTGGREYPWGDEAPSADRLNACGRECVAWGRKNNASQTAMYDGDDGFATTAPVGSFPRGASPYGLVDVVGNVWEWTADWYGPYRADGDVTRNPSGAANGKERVVRGGAWNGAYDDWVRPSFRWKNVPATRSYAIGFRCAKSL
jgi:formylglycine-generating enzyme required for sulfatase activity